MAKEKCAVLVYHDFYEHLKELSFEQKGKLFDAILEYDMTGLVSIKLDAVSSMAFKFIKAAIDRDKQAYEKRCAKNAENAAKGGRPKRDAQEKNQTDNLKTEQNPNEENKANGLNENPKKPNGYFQNQSDNLKTEKSERFFSKPKKPDKDTDNDNDTDNDKDPLPIEGDLKGEDRQAFFSFLNRVQGKIPDEHIENCFLSLTDSIKNKAGILKCTDDWLLTVFNQNEKTNFPAKSLVEYARANFEKYKPQKTMIQGAQATKEMLEKQAKDAKNAISPLEYSRDDALKWLKSMPDFWRKKSKIALKLLNRFNFNDEELKNNVDL